METKEVVIETNRYAKRSVVADQMEVEMVDSYKYFVTIIVKIYFQ